MDLSNLRLILVALDDSSHAASVLEASLGLAKKLGGKLLLLHAVGLPMTLPREALEQSPDAVQGLLEHQAKDAIDAQAHTLPPEFVAGTRVLTGNAFDSICRVAKEEDVDLIVIGSHGFSGIDRLLGTTAAKVVNHADRSVLVIHERGAAKPAG